MKAIFTHYSPITGKKEYTCYAEGEKLIRIYTDGTTGSASRNDYRLWKEYQEEGFC